MRRPTISPKYKVFEQRMKDIFALPVDSGGTKDQMLVQLSRDIRNAWLNGEIPLQEAEELVTKMKNRRINQ